MIDAEMVRCAMIVKQIVRDYPLCLNDRKLFGALASDYIRDRKLKNVLLLCHDEGIIKDISTAGSIKDLKFNGCVARLTSGYGIDMQYADYAITLLKLSFDAVNDDDKHLINEIFWDQADLWDHGCIEGTVPVIEYAASIGNADAEYYLGNVYSSGKGKKQNPLEATIWYERAGRHGHPLAAEFAGMNYSYKHYDFYNLEKAFECYLRSAELGDGDAQVVVAERYYYGKGTEQNREKAREWIIKAQNNCDHFPADYTDEYLEYIYKKWFGDNLGASSGRITRPGIRVNQRVVKLIFLVDASEEMQQDDVYDLKRIMDAALSDISGATADNPFIAVRPLVILMGSPAKVLTGNVDIMDFSWPTFNTSGELNICGGLSLLYAELLHDNEEANYLPPTAIIMLKSEAKPEYMSQVCLLEEVPLFKKTIKAAINLGNADNEKLFKRFTGNPELIFDKETIRRMLPRLIWSEPS